MSKKDCEIIEDLLLSYSDDVLNEETKKMVESHLKDCRECRKRLADIKKEDNVKEKIEVNYLKKLRRKTIMRSIIIAILIVFIMFMINYLYKFNIVSNMAKVAKEYEESDYYIEKISGHENKGKDEVQYEKEWKKGNKVKKESGNVLEDGTYETEVIEIKTVGERKTIYVDVKNKTASIYNDYFEKKANIPFGTKYDSNQNLIFRLGDPFYLKVSKDTREIGKWYYILDYGNDNKLWIDKETYEPIRQEGFSSLIEYYNNTKLFKKENKEVSQIIKLEKNNVNDEDMEIDLSSYKVIEEKDRNIEDLL